MARRDLVFLTGATGFVGSHILRELLSRGYSVRALRRRHLKQDAESPVLERDAESPVIERDAESPVIEQDAESPVLERYAESPVIERDAESPVIERDAESPVILSASVASSRRAEESASLSERSETKGAEETANLEWIEGDLRDVGAFANALRGCRYLIHCAALYSFAPRDRVAMHAVNVDATAGLMMAAYLAGVERGVLTSSSATLGHAHSGYHRSKLKQERAALSSRLPIVALLPTAPVGPGDAKPTPTGRLVLDFLRGKIVAKAPGHGGMNLVAVEDVARAHVSALELGNIGERYVIGGENLSMDEIWTLLAEITGKRMPSWRAPYALAYTAAALDELRCRITGGIPNVPLEGVELSRERMYADSAPARLELAYEATSVREALERAVAWYRNAFHLADGRVKNQ